MENQMWDEGFIPLEELDNGCQIAVIRDDEKIQGFYHSEERKELLVDINLKTGITTIFPTYTIEGSTHFLEPKYSKLKFVFEGYDTDIEKGIDTNKETNVLSGIPTVFTKQLRYGLGLAKEYRFIAEIPNKYFETCDTIIFTTIRETGIDKDTLIINDNELDNLRRGLNNIHENFRIEAIISKDIFVYTELLHGTNPERFPELKRTAQKEFIYKILKNIDFTKSKISQTNKQVLLEYKNTADLSYLQVLTNEFETKIAGTHEEKTYQKFFEENPFLLTMFAGSPYVKFQNQGYVGGKSFDNSNGKYPDFLLKHKAINNTFISEIKKPNAPLLENKAYRGNNVYAPSNELSGAISQVLSQKYSLETEIATLIKNAEDREVEAYNVQCLIIIGKISDLQEKSKYRSFELFRNNQKNIRIITYDECVEQLKSMIEFLSLQG